MPKLFFWVNLFWLLWFVQPHAATGQVTGAARRLYGGASAPPAARCTTTAHVGNVWVDERATPGTAKTSQCVNDNGSVGWSLMTPATSSGSGVPSAACTPPALHHRTDTNELYACSATNTWTLFAKSTYTPVLADSDGKVGIGTSSPLVKADIAGSTRITGTATSVLTGSIDPIASTTVTGVGTAFTTELVVGDRITVSGETRTVTAIASNTSLTVDTAFSDNGNDTSPDKLAAIFIARDSGGTPKMVVNDSGSVGIGTASPNGKLHVASGNVVFDTSYGIARNFTGGARKLVYSSGSSYGTTSIKPSDNYSSNGVQLEDFSGNARLFVGATSGAVGIGTTSPTITGTGKLHASGNTVRPFDTARTPASESEACNAGEIAFDDAYLSVCTATDTWRRASITWAGSTPTAHASTHASGESDEITAAISQVTGLQTALDGKIDTGVTLTDDRVLVGAGGSTVDVSPVSIDSSGNITGAASITVGDGTVAGEALMYEKSANGSNYRSWLVPDALTATVRFRFPNAAPTAGQFMKFGAPSSDISDATLTDLATELTAPLVNGPTFCTDAGSNDSYACNLSPALSAYTTGHKYRFKAATANTGAATLALNGLSAITIVKLHGGITTTLANDDIRANQWVEVVYDGTNFQMQTQVGNAPTGDTFPSQTGNSGKFLTTNGTAASWTETPVRRPNNRRWGYCNYLSGTTSWTNGCVGAAFTVLGTGTEATADSTFGQRMNMETSGSSGADAGGYGGTADRYNPAHQIRYQARVTVPAAGDYSSASIFIGLADGDYNAVNTTSWASGLDAFGFRAIAGTDTNWRCAHKAGGSTNVDEADSGVAVNTSEHTFELYYDYAANTVYYWIDGTAVCTGIAQTNRPGAVNMNHTIAIQASEAAVKNIQVSYVYLETDR